MKNFIYILLAFGMAMGLSCSETEPDIDLPPGSVGSIILTSDSPYVTIGSGASSAEVDFRSFAGTATIGIKADDRSWIIDRETAAWLTAEREGEKIIITATRNEDEKPRSSTIKIVVGQGNNSSSATIAVAQRGHGSGSIVLDTEQVHLTAGGQYPQTVGVTTDNDQWEVRTASNWLLVEQLDGALLFTADANPEIAVRETIVDVVAATGDGSKEDVVSVLVTQDEKAYLTFDVTDFLYTETGGEGEVTIETNREESWEVTNREDWMEVEKTGPLTFKFKILESSLIDDRIGNITVSAGELDNIAQSQVRIFQMGTDPEKMIFEYLTTENSPTVRLLLHGEVDCMVDWGDGSDPEHWNEIYPEHTYEIPGTYFVTVKGKVTALNGQPSSGTYRNMLTRVLRWGKTGLTSLQYGLWMCENLVSVAPDTAGSFSEVTNFYSAFANCFKLVDVPVGILDHATEGIDFGMCFAACYALEELPAGLFAKCSKGEDFWYALGQLWSLKSIPGDIFAGCTAMTNAKELFSVAPQTPPCTSIPGNLFAGCPNLEDVSSAFSGMGNVTQVGEDLFASCPKITNFGSTFSSTGLQNIPAGLFRNNTEAQSFNLTFYETPLKAIPAELFKNNINAQTFNSTFYDTHLKEVPDGLFAGLKNATAFNMTFQFSTIETIGQGVFAGCENANSFNGTFRYAPLKSIPADLFEECVNATIFQSTFRDLDELTSIPPGLFDNCRKVVNFSYCFSGCYDLQGESPYTMNGTDKIHLYEREDYPSIFTKPTNTTSCFANCRDLSDYYQIPTSWGGGKQ